MENIRGITCSFYNGAFRALLRLLSNEEFVFYAPWCRKIDNKQELLPKSQNCGELTQQELRQLSQSSIWELVLHMYPTGADVQKIETYEDFLNSHCECCLIFYDCGLLDIYTRNQNLREKMHKWLFSLQARDIELITDETDDRTHLYV